MFSKYCNTCNIDLCLICENEHDEHNLIDFKDIITNKDDLLKIKDDLNQVVNNFKYQIDIIKYAFDRMIKILEIYYNINNDIINNYNINKRN